MMSQFPLCFHDSDKSSFLRANFNKLCIQIVWKAIFSLGSQCVEHRVQIFDQCQKEEVKFHRGSRNKEKSPVRNDEPFILKI